MNKLIELIIAGLLFAIIIIFLVPMLPAPYSGYVKIIVVVASIVYVLGLIGNYQWPWNK